MQEEGRKAPGLPYPEREWEEMTLLGAQKFPVGIILEQGHPTRHLLHPQGVLSRCKADLVPPTHFLLSSSMLALTNIAWLSLITPTLLHRAPVLSEVAEGIVLISFPIFTVQCTALSLIYSLIETVG